MDTRHINKTYFISADDEGDDAITLSTDVTTGLFSAELTTIADSASLATGKGYKLGITTSFTDNNMVITINSITRVSEVIDPF